LWDGKAKLWARIALPDESTLFAEAKNSGQPSDGLVLVFLVELDGGETDELQSRARPAPDSQARTGGFPATESLVLA
jgi:hypothetical protein